MIRLLALVCLATGAFALFEKGTKLESGFRARFSINPLDFTFKKSFMEQPQTKAAAEKEKWVEVPKPEIHEEFSSLTLMCPTDCDYTLCLFYDDTDNVAGLQIAIDIAQFSGSIYDWKTQGFTYWEVDNKGNNEEYWTTQIYFSSPEYLQTSADTRLAARDSSTFLQDKYIYVSGINGKLHAISTDVAEIANTATSNFTEQACMVFMGHHYYYQMTEELPCNDELFPFFPLAYNNQLVGIGFVIFGKYETKKGCKDRFEKPDRKAVKLIVPRGPNCLYDLADNPGLVTMHIYFINDPIKMTCL